MRVVIKRILIIAGSILLAFLLFTIGFNWYFQPSRLPPPSREESREALLEKLEDDNSARYYLQACEALDDSTLSESLFERYNDVLTNGWREEDPELEDYITRNETALATMRKGTELESCSMPIDDPGFGGSYFSCFRQIARLVMVKGELLRRRKEYTDAVRLYSDSLRFCADASDMGTMLHALTGSAMEGLVYFGLDFFVADLNDEAVCVSLLNEMIDIESGRVPLSRILKSEFAFSQWAHKEEEKRMLYCDDFSDSEGFVKFFTRPIKRVWNYSKHRLLGAIYRRETERFGRHVIALVERPYPDIPRKELTENIPDNELSRLEFEPVRTFVFLTFRHQTIRRANIIRVALHLHYLENGTYPEKLDELTDVVPEEILIDPFSNQRFLYRKTDDGYLFYSVGSNMKDDGGVQAEPPWSEDMPGDIVFEKPGENRGGWCSS